jgi:signal transduction histidine kinase
MLAGEEFRQSGPAPVPVAAPSPSRVNDAHRPTASATPMPDGGGTPLATDPPRSLASRLGVAMVLAGLAIGVTTMLAASIPRTVFLPAFAAVSLAAWYGGAWGGFLASLICVVGVDWFVIPPVGDLRLSDPTDVISFSGFVAVSMLIGGMTSRLQEARLEAVRAAADLASANARLREQAAELERSNLLLQDTAAELEAQAEALQLTTADLTDRTTELASARAIADADRERLTRVIAQLPGAVGVLMGPEHVFAAASDAYVRLIGGRTLIGRRNADVFPELIEQGFIDLLDRVYETGEQLRGTDVPMRLDADGDGVPEDHLVDFTYRPLRAADGRVEGIVLELSEVTARAQLIRAERLARADAEQARRRAEEANAAKSQFLATMSHELRTPLNAIQGHTELLSLELYGPVAPRQLDALRRIDRAQRHLLGLINDILSYARLESGKVEYDLDVVPVADVVRYVVPLVEPQLAAKGITLQTRLPDEADGDGGAPVRVRADREKLAQILLNLLSNAHKFTPADGRVVVDVDADGDGDGDGTTVRLSVRDTGVGIPADKLEAVFEPFVQVRTGYTSTGSGTGLGLSISRDLARGMGGDLTAESEPGMGSTFTLLLPRA